MAQGADDNGDYLGTTESQAGSGWNGIFGFFDGIRGVTDRVEAISGDVAGTAGNISDAQRAFWELQNDKADAAQDRAIEWFTVERGDNKQLYYALAAGAVAVIIIFAR
ncbi:TPA_inf: hypothetical protein gp_10 [Marinomonas phage YY]|nr:TPA_inf: hypothetical protein gp_10 [Marinomonas phage YY]